MNIKTGLFIHVYICVDFNVHMGNATINLFIQETVFIPVSLPHTR